jgi:basic membrane protein A
VAKRFSLFLTLILSITLAPIFPVAAAPEKPKIGIIYDVGGRGDKAINDAAAVGIDSAKKRFKLSNFDVRELVTTGIEFDRENRIEFLVKAQYDLVIGVGSSFNSAMIYMSEKYPESQFAVIASSGVESINVSCMAFDLNQGSFLAGVMAALNSKTGKVGYLGDVSNLSNSKNLQNFRAGVKYAGSKFQVVAANAAATADKEIAKLSGQGADVFFINWSRNGSVLTAANKLAKAKTPIKIIGVRPDQFFIATKDAQKFLIGYVNQRFDNAINDLFSAAVSGRSITEEVDVANGVFGRNYTLSNSGIDLIATSANSASKSAVSRAKSGIISKKIAIAK